MPTGVYKHTNNSSSFRKGHTPWNKEKSKIEFPQLGNCGIYPRTEITKKSLSIATTKWWKTHPEERNSGCRGGWNKGLTKETAPSLVASEESKRKNSAVHLSNKNSLGHTVTPEARTLISIRVKEALANNEIREKLRWRKGLTKDDPRVAKQANTLRLRWLDPDFIRTIYKAQNISPNNPEILLNSLLQNNFPRMWKYVGDGKDPNFIIGRMRPDFADINGKKQLIEMFGDYWHRNQDPNNRICRFAKFGYDCLVIWEHELKSNQIEETIGKIKSFVGG